MKKIFYIVAILIFGLTSCSREEENLFEDSAANRITAAQQKYREILTNAPNGWVMEYYAGHNIPNAEKRTGGLAFLMDFDKKGNVRIASEYAGVEPVKTVVTSTYNLIANQSVVLTFDTHNSLLHYFSEPSSSDLDGLGGDYEFVVMDVTEEKIELKGRRNGNRIVMRQLEKNVDWDTYLDGIKAFRKRITYSNFYIYVNGTKTGNVAALDIVNHNLIIEGTQEENVTFSPDGINLYLPMEIAGHSVESFTWNETQGKLVTTVDNVTIALEGYNTEGYSTYEDYAGTYWLNYTDYLGRSAAKRGTIKEIDGTNQLELTGLDFPVILKYDNITGSIYFDFQYIQPQVANPQYDVYLFNWFGEGGITTDGSLHYSGKWGKSATGTDIIEFSSNEPESGHVGMCFVAYLNGGLYMISESAFFRELKMSKR